MYNSDQRILHLITVLIFQKDVSTIREFCAKIDIKESTITKIKRDKAHFTAQHIERICHVFKVNANWIFDIDTKVFRTPKSIEIKDI